MKKTNFVLAAICFSIFSLLTNAQANNDKKGNNEWVSHKASTIKNYPDLVHYAWESLRPPYGEYDRIILHRIVNKRLKKKKNRRTKKVMLFLPGSWQRGWSELDDENTSPYLFYANNGYDVYSIDFRSRSLPNMTYAQFQENGIDISGTIDWTLGVYREDIKACVTKIKKITKKNKIFMMGFSRGGIYLNVYANKYQDDLKGIILLDGYPKDFSATGNIWDEQTHYVILDLLKRGLLEHPEDCVPWVCSEPNGYFAMIKDMAPYNYDNYQLAGVSPFAKQLVGMELSEEFYSISDFVADEVHYKWGGIGLANYYDGYIERDVLVKVMAEFSRYYASVQDLEVRQIEAWEDVPYLDYDDNEIYLPMLAIQTSFFCDDGSCVDESIPNISEHPDSTVILIPGYKHLDLLHGINSVNDVKQTIIDWMDERSNQ